jgi:hypothetical protein
VLDFEVTLNEWFYELDLTEAQDKGIIKKLIRPGHGVHKPQEDVQVDSKSPL